MNKRQIKKRNKLVQEQKQFLRSHVFGCFCDSNIKYVGKKMLKLHIKKYKDFKLLKRHKNLFITIDYSEKLNDDFTVIQEFYCNKDCASKLVSAKIITI
jgi:hypothetical protein